MKASVVETKEAQRSLEKVPLEILRAYEIWVRLVEQYGSGILKDYKGYNDEKLHGQWKGSRSSRLNRKWRVLYKKNGFSDDLEVVDVIRVTPHDYRRR